MLSLLHGTLQEIRVSWKPELIGLVFIANVDFGLQSVILSHLYAALDYFRVHLLELFKFGWLINPLWISAEIGLFLLLLNHVFSESEEIFAFLSFRAVSEDVHEVFELSAYIFLLFTIKLFNVSIENDFLSFLRNFMTINFLLIDNRSFVTLIDNVLNSLLDIETLYRLKVQEEAKDSFKCLLGLQDKIFVSYEVSRGLISHILQDIGVVDLQ